MKSSLDDIKAENRIKCQRCGKVVYYGRTVDKGREILLDSAAVPFSYVGSGALVTPVEALVPHSAVCRRKK